MSRTARIAVTAVGLALAGFAAHRSYHGGNWFLFGFACAVIGAWLFLLVEDGGRWWSR